MYYICMCMLKYIIILYLLVIITLIMNEYFFAYFFFKGNRLSNHDFKIEKEAIIVNSSFVPTFSILFYCWKIKFEN